MAGVVPLRKIIIGKETTAGTAVAGDVVWRGKGTLEDMVEPVPVDEQVGYLSGTDNQYIPFVEGKLTMEASPATFEQLPHIFEAGIETDAPAQDGAGTGYIYEYIFPTTSKNTIATYTIEGGDDQQEEEMAYCFVTNFGLSGKSKEAVMVSADWMGRQIAPSTFTSVALATCESILFQKAKLYIDAVAGTIGTTLVSSTMLGFDMKVATGIHPKYTADGQLYYTFHDFAKPEITLDLTWEHNASAVTEKANWRAGTARQIRLLIEGSALGTAGTAYTYKTLTIDLAGKWRKFSKIGDNGDGNDIVTGTFVASYNSTAALFAEILVINELSALP